MTRIIPDAEKCTSITRQKCLTQKCITASVMFMTVSSIILFIIFWCTNLFQSAIISNLVVSKNSQMLEYWLSPPIRAVYKIRIFNYTNVEDFESGKDEKLKVEETGPYIYREILTRVNQVFHSNGTVSFQEKRSFQWEGGSPDDEIIVVPNVPLLSAMAFAKDIHFIAQLGLTGVITALQPKTFISIPAGGFLWGYDDKLFDAAKPILSVIEDIPIDKFGMLALKNGVSKDVVTMHTGSANISEMGLIDRINGKNTRNVWGDKSCDRVYGSIGYIYPPGMYEDANSTLEIYSVDMCRTLTLKRSGEGSSFGIPTMSFKPPADGFHFTLQKDYCFCSRNSVINRESTRTCPPRGIFRISACSFNMPLSISLPHFLEGDQSLFENIKGLEPVPELHESQVEIHPRLGIVIGGHSRFQMNIEANKAIGVPFLGKVRDGEILPLLWIEVGIDGIPDSILNILKQAYFTAGIVEISCQWGSIFGIILFTSVLIHLLKKNKEKHSSLRRNISGQNKLLEENH